jgi:hypothetical protein
MYTAYKSKWEPYMTREDRIEEMKKQLEGFRDQLAWSTDYQRRLEAKIAQIQEDIDLEVAEFMKHK